MKAEIIYLLVKNIALIYNVSYMIITPSIISVYSLILGPVPYYCRH